MAVGKIPTTQEILQFIKDAQFIQPWELSNKYGYTQRFAENKIYRLHKARLIDNSIPGKWNLTTEGLRRLNYYNAKDQEKARNGK
jgi:hypothetical protein